MSDFNRLMMGKRGHQPSTIGSSLSAEENARAVCDAHEVTQSSGLQKVAVVVLGMHRSGTSSVAGTLTKLGAKAPRSLMEPTPFNERGLFESFALMHLNDEVLAAAGTRWDDWRAFNDAWYSSVELAQFEKKATAILAQEYRSARLILVKDPRMCRIMPFWKKVFLTTGHAARYILPVRSPLEVARSLGSRDGFPISQGLLVWLRYVLNSEEASRDLPRAILHWPDFLADWRLEIARVAEEIGIVWPKVSDRSAHEIDNFLTPALRHNVVPNENLAIHPDVNDWVRETYEAMITLAANPSSSNARRQLDNVSHEFKKASEFFGRVFVDYEDNVTRALGDARGARAEHEILIRDASEHRLRAEASVTERDNILGECSALVGKLTTACTERDWLAGEVADQRMRADALVVERDAMIGKIAVLKEQHTSDGAERESLASELAEQRRRTDELVVERNATIDKMGALGEQLTAACAERERLASEAANQRRRADALVLERNTTISENAILAEQLTIKHAERNRLAGEAAELRMRVSALIAERDAAADDRAELAERSGASWAERDLLAAEASEQRVRADKLVLERNALQARLNSLSASTYQMLKIRVRSILWGR